MTSLDDARTVAARSVRKAGPVRRAMTDSPTNGAIRSCEGPTLALDVTTAQMMATTYMTIWRRGTERMLGAAPMCSLMAMPERIFMLVIRSGALGGFHVDARRKQGGCRYYLCDAASQAAVVERGNAPLPTPTLNGLPPPRMRPS